MAKNIVVEEIKTMHAKQLKIFEKWTTQNEFQKIHSAHYDWWMFPINEKSSFREKYTVRQAEVDLLKSDAKFMEDFRRGVYLVSLAWGYDVLQRKQIDNPAKGQEWTHYPVRLYKMGRACQVLGENDLFESLHQWAKGMAEKGEKLVFHSSGYDCMLNTLDGWNRPVVL